MKVFFSILLTLSFLAIGIIICIYCTTGATEVQTVAKPAKESDSTATEEAAPTNTEEPTMEETVTPNFQYTINFSELVLGRQYPSTHVGTLTFLGNPSEKYYTSYDARNPWDLLHYNGNIYIGSGDASATINSVPLLVYSTDIEEFKAQDTLSERQLSNLKVLSNLLVFPGNTTQKTGKWHIYTEGTGTLHRSALNNTNCYDIVTFHEKLYIATENDILVSQDGGFTFRSLPCRSSSNLRATPIYHLFTFQDQLYALGGNLMTPVLYQYDEVSEEFHYSAWSELSSIYGYARFEKMNNAGVPIARKEEFNGHMLFVSHDMGYTKDMCTIQKFKLEENSGVYDILIQDETLYVLVGTKLATGNYRISIYATQEMEKWTQVLSCTAPSYARSFEKVGNDFYLALGSDYGSNNSHNGEIYRITVD